MRENPNDLAARIKRMEDRIATLERALRAASTSIRSGRIALIDGTLTLTDADDGFSEGTRGKMGFMPYTANDDEGYVFYVNRAVGMGGTQALWVTTVDGSVTGDSFTPTFMVFDKKGGRTIAGDAAGHRRGMAEPRLQIPWWKHPADLASSTSTTFDDVAGFTWYAYHPHCRVHMIVQNDASTPSEVQIVLANDGTVLASAVYAGGTNSFVSLDIRREDLINDQDGVNGNLQAIEVQHRRVSGAGTVRTMLTDVVGIDLSMFD
jgi:hypothetical protein